MNFLKATLSGVAAILLVGTGPTLGFIIWALASTRASGVGLDVGGFWKNIYSPWFWIIAVLFFVLFLAAGRLANQTLRVLLFWIPTLLISISGLALVALTYSLKFFVSR